MIVGYDLATLGLSIRVPAIWFAHHARTLLRQKARSVITAKKLGVMCTDRYTSRTTSFFTQSLSLSANTPTTALRNQTTSHQHCPCSLSNCNNYNNNNNDNNEDNNNSNCNYSKDSPTSTLSLPCFPCTCTNDYFCCFSSQSKIEQK